MIGNSKKNNYGLRRGQTVRSWDDPEYDVLFPETDLDLFAEIGEYMQAVKDIEEVTSDPGFSMADDASAKMITGHEEKGGVNPETERFVRSVLAEEKTVTMPGDEIKLIEQEAAQGNVKKITSEWVEEWLREGDKDKRNDPKRREISEFITSSRSREESVPVNKPEGNKRTISGKSRILAFTSLAAAAIIGAVFLVRSLLPAGDGQSLFNKYYEPFNAVSPVTRGMANEGRTALSKAIYSYRSRDYRSAEAGFTEAMKYETVALQASFFLGITEIELENTGRAAELLENVINRQGAYSKEATWYLGLASVKSGNKTRALECFSLLAGSPGFYQDSAEKILRRLK